MMKCRKRQIITIPVTRSMLALGMAGLNSRVLFRDRESMILGTE